MHFGKRVLLIDPNESRREVLTRRLRAQGYVVDGVGDPAYGADMALSSPPDAIVADLWMPSISGVQLCRLLRAEPATADVPVVLCGEKDEPRNRFWAERAGAVAHVIKGRTGDLMRALASAVQKSKKEDDGFFVQLSGGSTDIRDRLARHLDEALFDSVIAAELRSLVSAGSFDRLFDLLAQLLTQLTRYRWIALTARAERLAIHHHPSLRDAAEEEARAALECASKVTVMHVEDEDASNVDRSSAPNVCWVPFAGNPVARFALSPCPGHEADGAALAAVVARELGAAIRIAALVEDSERLASTDALTGLMNRRAFVAAMQTELARANRHEYPLTLALLDIDHFKRINDGYGHLMGDRVLSSIGDLLRERLRQSDIAARWGGEEFVVAYTSTDKPGGLVAAERLRQAIEQCVVRDEGGQRIPLTGSIGVACWRPGEPLESLVERADLAMYRSKTGGRNRVTESDEPAAPVESRPALAS